MIRNFIFILFICAHSIYCNYTSIDDIKNARTEIPSYSGSDLWKLKLDIDEAKSSPRYKSGRGFARRIDNHIVPVLYEVLAERQSIYNGNLENLQPYQVHLLIPEDIDRVASAVSNVKERSKVYKHQQHAGKGAFFDHINKLNEALVQIQPSFASAGVLADESAAAAGAASASAPFRGNAQGMLDEKLTLNGVGTIKGFLKESERLLVENLRSSRLSDKNKARMHVMRANIIGMLNHEIPLKSSVARYKRVGPLPKKKSAGYYFTNVEFLNLDTLDAFFQLHDMLKHDGALPAKIAVLDMANAFSPGGGVMKGTGAQEEQICYRSTLFPYLLAAKKTFSPVEEGGFVPELGTLYVNNVIVLREGERSVPPYKSFKSDDPRLEIPFSVIVSAAYNRKVGKRGYGPQDKQEYERNMLEKIKAQLRVALENNHSDIILGAFGCGAFQNDNRFLSRLYREALESDEFKRKFRNVWFAILDENPDLPRSNFRVFKDTFENFER